MLHNLINIKKKQKNLIKDKLQMEYNIINDKKEAAQKQNKNEASSEHIKETDSIAEPEYEIVEKEILPEKMICPDCGGITLVGLEYCDKCGGELINHDN